MTTLIAVTDGTPTTTSIIIAGGINRPHAGVIKLVRRYRPDLEVFGGVRFEIQPFETCGGVQKKEIAILNERQATFLLTLMRNTPVVLEFKKELVKAFYELAEHNRHEPMPLPYTMLHVPAAGKPWESIHYLLRVLDQAKKDRALIQVGDIEEAWRDYKLLNWNLSAVQGTHQTLLKQCKHHMREFEQILRGFEA